MSNTSRRTFLTATAALGAAITLPVHAADKPVTTAAKDSLPHLLHHVFFWLKNPDSESDRAELIAGIKSLAAIEAVRAIHVGIPASTEKRDVVEMSYHVSELLCFDDVEGQNVYQVHPLHAAFVEKHQHLWSKVVVYDVLAV